jgi:hypothetical protein
MNPLHLLASAAILVVAGLSVTTCTPPAGGEGLRTALSLNVVCNGVSTTRDGRIFLVLSGIDGSAGPRVAEWVDGRLKPYPDDGWNSWSKGESADKALVRVNAWRASPPCLERRT